MPTVAYILVQNNHVQTYLVKTVAREASRSLNANFELEEVDISLFNRVILRNVTIEDQQGEVILHTNKVTAGLRKLNPNTRKVNLGLLRLDQADFHFILDSTKEVNIQFIIDALKSKKDSSKSSRKKWDLIFENIEIRNSTFALTAAEKLEVEYGIDFSDMFLSDLNLAASGLKKTSDSVAFTIDRMSFKEKSGFALLNLQSDMNVSKTHMDFEDLSIRTSKSQIDAGYYRMKFDHTRDLSAGKFGKKVYLRGDIETSRINLDDLAWFSPTLLGMDAVITISGRLYGHLNDIRFRDLSVKTGRNTILTGDFNLDGLPNIKNTFFYLDIDNLIFDKSEIENITLPLASKNSSIKLPDILSRFSLIQYNGKFTGFYDDFVTYGRFNTDLGRIATDLAIQPDTAGLKRFKGNVSTTNFKLGKFLRNNEVAGNLSMKLNVNGNGNSIENLNAKLKGGISRLELKEYAYANIEIDGEFANRAFDGSIEIRDKNVEMDLMGRFDFDKEVPEFDFTANMPFANLYPLNLTEDSTFTASALVIANFAGNDFDNFNGDVKVLHGELKRADKELLIYDFNLSALTDNVKNLTSLQSQFLNAEIEGNYNFKTLKESFDSYVGRYLPSLYSKERKQIITNENGFSFSIDFIKFNQLAEFFLPSLEIAPETEISGQYFPSRSDGISLQMASDKISYKDIEWREMYVNTLSNDERFSIESGSHALSINDQLELGNFSVYADGSHNEVDLRLRWSNWDSIIYKGTVNAVAKFSELAGSKFPSVNIALLPTDIVVGDTIWKILASNIKIDTSTINIDNFSIINNDQYIKLDGIASKNAEEKLVFDFQNIGLNYLNLITAKKNLYFTGVTTGKAEVSDIYNNPGFLSEIKINDLTLNGENFGESNISANWNNENEAILISASTQTGEIKTINLSGFYTPRNQNLDLDLQIDRLHLRLFRPYVENIFADLNGLASGKVKIDGKLSEPLLNGEVQFQKTSFGIDYLQTRYSFTSPVQIIDNIFTFNEVNIFDRLSNKAVVSGEIRNNHLSDFFFDLKINTDNYLFLDTRASDNSSFYGTAYASALVGISGTPEKITMNISAKTERNTQFFIPLAEDGEVSEYTFIDFVDPANARDSIEQAKQQKRNQNEESSSLLVMNFDLEVTPDAEVQIIFDPKVGDIMRGRGSGNLQMEATSKGDFKIFGDFQIESGDYLFTLQNVINKRFTVQPGGMVEWNGDPANAMIDVNAVYRLKTSIHDLFVDPDEEYNRRIPVECHLKMTESLENPEIEFDIYLPTAEEEVRSRVRSIMATEEELSKQFLSLLVINSFLPNQNATGPSSTGNLGSAGVGVTTSEMLSNQLSNWLSQISNEFDVGVNYRPGDEMFTDEVELALSTQLLNDRVSINGNLDMGGNQQSTTAATNSSTSAIVGDFIVDVKLNKSGKLRVKAYNKANDNLLIEDSPYTQGVGLFYREEFNTIPELWRRYFGFMYPAEKREGDNENIGLKE